MIRGSCLCGGIQFEADSVPLITTCHCSKCRKTRGSAFSATACVPISEFRFVRGEELIQTYQPATGNYANGFCRRCGSNAPWWEITDNAPQFEEWVPGYGPEGSP